MYKSLKIRQTNADRFVSFSLAKYFIRYMQLVMCKQINEIRRYHSVVEKIKNNR